MRECPAPRKRWSSRRSAPDETGVPSRLGTSGAHHPFSGSGFLFILSDYGTIRQNIDGQEQRRTLVNDNPSSSRSLFDLDGRVAVVTGGSRGLGLQIA